LRVDTSEEQHRHIDAGEPQQAHEIAGLNAMLWMPSPRGGEVANAVAHLAISDRVEIRLQMTHGAAGLGIGCDGISPAA
jgi:hypothetical protein